MLIMIMYTLINDDEKVVPIFTLMVFQRRTAPTSGRPHCIAPPCLPSR